MYDWNYTLTGDRSLPPLLLLHGWMGCNDDYAVVIDRLQSRFYCIAIDLPGHGKTEVIGGDLGFDFIATATGIMQLLVSLAIDRCSISGYSFGGRLALYLALEFPDRFTKVILESASSGLPTATERAARIVNDERIIAELATNDLLSFIINWYHQPIFQGIDEHPDFPALIRRRVNNQPIDLAKSLKYAGLGRQPYLGDRLKISNLPILLIVGANDPKFVLLAQALDRDCPCINLQIVPNCSHNVHFQQPFIWSQLI